jgi:dihydroorotase
MKYLLKNGEVINRGKRFGADVLIVKGRVEKVGGEIAIDGAVEEIDCTGKLIIPGMIDDQVHFREPGLTHKATIYMESRAAVAGGVTSFMEMPNTNPAAFTQKLLQDKYDIAARDAAANYSFFMGTSNDNFEEVLRTDPKMVCGVKIFMGSSTGNLLVDDRKTLDRLFSSVPMLIATHCEDEQTIIDNLATAEEKYGSAVPISMHPVIRSREACYMSSSLAIELAKKHGTRLHILHITTREELSLFSVEDTANKKITSEACVHHMTFSNKDYLTLGNQIKCNPAIKLEPDRLAIIEAVRDGRIDVIATDHAPHTWDEKSKDYLHSPSGLPLVQHPLVLLLQLYHNEGLALETIVDRACHGPAKCFDIADRGYIDEGYWADVVVLDLDKEWTIDKDGLLYKCAWSPLVGLGMKGCVERTFVNGEQVYADGRLSVQKPGMRLTFDR